MRNLTYEQAIKADVFTSVVSLVNNSTHFYQELKSTISYLEKLRKKILYIN